MRTRVVLVAVALGLVAAGLGAFAAEVVDALAIGAAAFAIALIAGIAAISFSRVQLRKLAAAAQTLARDHDRRIPIDRDAAPTDEIREIGTWLNYLAEEAEKSRLALARDRTLLAAVADGLTQGVIAVDGELRIELLNDAARRMLGVTSSPVGEPLLVFVRVPELRDLIESSVESSTEIQLPDGPRTLIRVARKWGGEGRVLLLEDVTAMRRLETVRRDFVANVSHELRTPVAVIRANAETLQAGAKNDPIMSAKLVDGLHRNSERLARILADLLDLSRLDAGQYRLDLGRVSVLDIAEQSLTAVEPQMATRKVTVDVTMPRELAVKADPKALDHILVNLIDNGVKYTQPEGHVWVEARPDGDSSVRIEVRDDGPGITAKHRARVFERFYRADPSRSREAGGTGLGLSIVKHLVESMGGQVGVEPNEPKGSVFWLRLPRSELTAS